MSLPDPLAPPPLAQPAIVGATASLASRLGAESRRTPSHSKRTAAGLNPARALATTNTRRRRWAKPKYWASRIRHATARVGPSTQPASAHRPPAGRSGSSSPASPAKKQPKALSLALRTPGTFSQKMTAGCFPKIDRVASMAFAISQKVSDKLPRASAKDLRSPATLKAWHGVPPQNTSGASTCNARTRSAKRLMSPRLGTAG
jgi:hypothetical protein